MYSQMNRLYSQMNRCNGTKETNRSQFDHLGSDCEREVENYEHACKDIPLVRLLLVANVDDHAFIKQRIRKERRSEQR